MELGQLSPGRWVMATSGGERDHRVARTHDKYHVWVSCLKIFLNY